MEATCWSDYLCPWCYVGLDRSRIMDRLGIAVIHRPYDLHPEVPAAGRAVRPGSGLDRTFARVQQACEEVGLRFRPPTRTPNSRRALETSEWVRIHHPDASEALHRALFDAHFARGLAIDDPAVLDQLVTESGGPAAEVRLAVDKGRASPLVDQSMTDARATGVSSTPTWVLGDGFIVPGALDPATLERWLSRIVSRADATPPSSPH